MEYNGLKIEVKTSAYWQTWKQEKRSRPVFAIPKKHGWKGETSQWDDEIRRHADIYVFCLYAEENQSKARENILDTNHWKFYIVPTEKLPEQKTIGLSSLQRLTDSFSFGEIESRINLEGEKLRLR
jgi:hypothetical protein